ncbi:MAG: hypothetical protein P0S93_03910 [Candidatus Neptunochlamydia sp.]|nr:hypothetical protein [Candidatus Neptunochlamydia sp.]
MKINNFIVESAIYTTVIGFLWKNRGVAILSKESIPYAGLLASYIIISASSMGVCDKDKNKNKEIIPLLGLATAALAAYGYFGKDKIAKSIDQKHLGKAFLASGWSLAIYYAFNKD